MAFDRTNATHLQALQDEVNLDPEGLGYNVSSGDTNLIISLINDINPATLVSKAKISSASVRSACTYDAYNNLSIDEQEWLRWITGTGGGAEEEDLIVTDDVRTQLTGPNTASIWAASDRTAMNQAMLDLIDVPGSRAEVLWGHGTSITSADWLAARDHV